MCFFLFIPCQAYKELSNDKKDSFIKLFEKSRGNLNWVHDFKEKAMTFNKTESITASNFLNRNQIFRLNGFDVRDFADDDAGTRMLSTCSSNSLRK